MSFRIATLAILLATCSAVAESQASAGKPSPIRISGPTVIAFYAYDRVHPEAAGVKAESDEALDDFQFYSAKAKELMQKKGVAFQGVYDLSFSIQIGKRCMLVESKQFKYGIGYYFIAPGRRPHLEYGVMTDEDMLQAVDKYFAPPRLN